VWDDVVDEEYDGVEHLAAVEASIDALILEITPVLRFVCRQHVNRPRSTALCPRLGSRAHLPQWSHFNGG